MTATHLSTTVVETHRSADDGTLVVGRARLRTPAETSRLRRLAAVLCPDRTFAVTRNVIVSPAAAERAGAPRCLETVTYTVLAANGAEARFLADAAKLDAEVKIGHHQ